MLYFYLIGSYCIDLQIEMYIKTDKLHLLLFHIVKTKMICEVFFICIMINEYFFIEAPCCDKIAFQM